MPENKMRKTAQAYLTFFLQKTFSEIAHFNQKINDKNRNCQVHIFT